MAMPETPMHENRRFQIGEDDIRRSWKVFNMAPVADSGGAEEFFQTDFRGGVFPLDPRHDPGTFGAGEDVGHFKRRS